MFRSLLFWLLLLLFFALSVLIPRYKWDRANRDVLIVLDLPSLQLASVSEQKNWQEAIQEIPKEGVVIALPERDFETCAGVIFEFAQAENGWRIRGKNVEEWFSFRVPSGMYQKISDEEVLYTGTQKYLEGGCGWYGAEIQALQALGFPIILRPRNPANADLWAIRSYLAFVEQFSTHKILLPVGAEYLGYPNHLVEVKRLASLPGFVEFTRMKGAEAISPLLHSIKVHSITEEDWMRLDEKKALLRLLRAVQERNIRALYLHFPSYWNIANVSDFLRKLQQNFTAKKYQLGWKIPPPDPPEFHPLTFPFLHLLFLLFFLFFLPAQAQNLAGFSFFGAMAAFYLAGFFFPGTHILWVMIWISLYPALVYIHLFQKSGWQWEQHSLLTVLGGLSFSSALATPGLMKGSEALPWVKFAWILPLLVSGYFLFRYTAGESSFRRAVTYQELFLFIALLAILAYMLIREELGIGVTQAEQLVREKMEHWLGIRPRWREIFCHPAYILFHRRPLPRETWTIPFYLWALLGQVSAMNSFLHLHTPFFLTLSRIFWGWLIGGILGYFLLLCLNIYEHFSGRVFWSRKSGR